MENTGMIRPGTPEDKTTVARLMIQAMKELASKFINNKDPYAAIPAFEYFYEQPATAYSHENTLVYTDDRGIAGSATAYDGARFLSLREPILNYLQAHYGFNTSVEPETSAGEYYLDTVSVFPDRQGAGIGKKLILGVINRAGERGHSHVGLLVNEAKPYAKKIYLGLGFEVVDVKYILGGKYEHMVRAV